MKLLRVVWFKFLKLLGFSMNAMYKKCISSLEERLSELDDDEYFVAIMMLDAGSDCEAVFITLRTARRKRTFKRKLAHLGIKGASVEHLLEKFMNDLRSDSKIDNLVTNASTEYADAAERRKAKLK
jgi:hypothetical protein